LAHGKPPSEVSVFSSLLEENVSKNTTSRQAAAKVIPERGKKRADLLITESRPRV